MSRNIIILGLVSMFTDLSTEMAYPVIPLFLRNILHAQPFFIGLIEAIAESTASILKSLSGYISDRFKKRKLFIFIGYTFSAFVKPLLALATAGWQVLLVRFADRFGKGIRTAPRDALISDSAPQEYWGRTYGFHRAADTLGAVLGPFLAFLILGILKQNYRFLFGIAFIPGFIAVLLIIFGIKEIVPKTRMAFKFSFNKLSRKFKIFLLVMVIFTLGNSSDAFLLLRAKEIGVSSQAIPLLWLVFNAAYFIWSYPAGVISDRIGRIKTIFLGLFIFAGTYTGLALAHKPIYVWLLFGIYGLYYGFTVGNQRAFVADLTDREIRATAFGFYYAALGVTLLPANLLMGFLWQQFGFQIALYFGSGLALFSGILLLSLSNFFSINKNLRGAE